MRLKKQIRLEKKRAKVERIKSKNEARVTLANQGIQKKIKTKIFGSEQERIPPKRNLRMLFLKHGKD